MCDFFFANYMNILHKTEVQMIILRCCTGLYLNWFKSYDTIYQSQILEITLYVIVKWSPIKYHKNTTCPKLYMGVFSN